MKYLILLLFATCSTENNLHSKVLMVADHLEDCTGVSNQKCLLIKENPGDDWTYFYDQIEGFDYEEGYEYEILVEVVQLKNQPADASAHRYVLKQIRSKSKSANHKLNGHWKVIQMQEQDQISINPTIILNTEELKVNGFAGCNNYFSDFTIEGEIIQFGLMGSTRKMCEDMSVEDHFFKIINQVARFKVVKKELYLYDANDNLLFLAIAVKQ